MSTLDAVLGRIDQDFDQSLERLFALLRIASVSTDPAYKEQCRAAAEHVAADLDSIGFASSVRPTEGHPVVVGKANGAMAKRPARAVLRALRRAAGRSAELMEDAAVRAAHRDLARRPQASSSRAAPATTRARP